MYKLKDNDRSHIDFAVNPDYEIEVSFSKWTNKVSPIVKQTFDFIESDTKIEFELIKAIYCDAASQEEDSTVKKHFVLFIKEVKKSSNNQLLESANIPLKYNDKFRLVTVRYFLADTNIPDAKDIDCKYYHDVIDKIMPLDDGIIPDTNNGSIIIKK